MPLTEPLSGISTVLCILFSPSASTVGLGKAGEVPEAIRKGKEAAVKNLVEIPMDENNSIPHDFIGKFGSANVLLKRAPEGTGIIDRDLYKALYSSLFTFADCFRNFSGLA